MNRQEMIQGLQAVKLNLSIVEGALEDFKFNNLSGALLVIKEDLGDVLTALRDEKGKEEK